MDVIEIVRWINLSLAILAIIGWLYFYRKFREPAAIAPLTWLINIACYFAFRLISLGFDLSIKNTYFLNLWSSLLHTHGILLLGIGVFIACGRLINNKTYMDRLLIKLMNEEAEKNHGN